MERRPVPGPKEAPSDWPRFRIFGLTLATNLPLATQLPQTDLPADLVFTYTHAPLVDAEEAHESPVFQSRGLTENGQSLVLLYSLSNYVVLRFTGSADFYFWPDRIVCHLCKSADESVLESRLLGPVLALWLEMQGIVTLHASAVEVNGKLIAFLSRSRGGKTSLAATFLQAGFSLLTDDLLPIEFVKGTFWSHPTYPQMRMWPEQAQFFLGSFQDLPYVSRNSSKRRVPIGPATFGKFCDTSEPLSLLYLPQIKEDTKKTVETVPMSGQGATIELVRHSFLPHLVAALGLQARRINILSQLAHQVPMRRLIFQASFANLPTVRTAILQDLENLREDHSV